MEAVAEPLLGTATRANFPPVASGRHGKITS
jgi:hypothetical protein